MIPRLKDGEDNSDVNDSGGNQNTGTERLKSPADRLSYILDKIEFKKGHGRVAELVRYLKETDELNFSNLNYQTVHSWLNRNSPAMKKMIIIMECLGRGYQLGCDERRLSQWWKIGGEDPFNAGSLNKIEELDEERRQRQSALNFQIMAVLTAEPDSLFADLNGEQLSELVDKGVQFARDFEDPFKNSINNDQIKTWLTGYYHESMKSNK